MARSFFGGVYPKGFKELSCEAPIVPLRPKLVSIAMSQHIGKPCTPLVKVGDRVTLGQKIGDGQGLCVPVHASVSGTVVAVEMRPTPAGTNGMCVVIESDGRDTLCPTVKKRESIRDLSPEELTAIIREAGITGMGGAGFPTNVKISSGMGKVDTVIVNGAECEPYLTSDYRQMMENTDLLLEGIELVLQHLKIEKAVIGIENNKPKAIEKIRAEAEKRGTRLTVRDLKARYPQGAEKVIVYESTGRVIPEGKLPSDVGVIVMNVGTVIKLAHYVQTGIPLISRLVTIDGGAVKEPKNVWVPIGTKIEDIVNFCGGYNGEPAEILFGGPMMGVSCKDDQASILKNNNGILVFNEKEAKMAAETACIRCGRCMHACPVGLNPAGLDRACHAEDREALKKLKVNICMECGCCAYVCPAKRHLVAYNQMGKQMIK